MVCVQKKRFVCFICKISLKDCPSTLSKHFANLFLRDPLYVTDEQISSDQKSGQTFAFEVCISFFLFII